jgi:hypothetical protein
MSCYKLRKKDCLAQEKNCTWVVRKGCKSKVPPKKVASSTSTQPLNVLANKDISSVIKKELSFIDRVHFFKAKNSKTSDLQIIRIATSPPTFFKNYINIVPIVQNVMKMAKDATYVVGTYKKKPFMIAEFRYKKTEDIYYYTIIDNICIHREKLHIIKRFDESISNNTEAIAIYNHLAHEFDLPRRELKEIIITTFQPKTYEKNPIDIQPTIRGGKYTFVLDENSKLTFTPKFNTVASTGVIYGFRLSYSLQVKKPKFSIDEDTINFGSAKKYQDITQYWSKAYNVVTPFLNNLDADGRAKLIKHAFKGIKFDFSKVDFEATWKTFNSPFEYRPMIVLEKI